MPGSTATTFLWRADVRLSFVLFLVSFVASSFGDHVRASDSAQTGPLTVAAAASLKPALEAIRKDFLASNPTDSVTLIFGSSTKLRTQIANGAPFEMFFSADMSLLDELVQQGAASQKPVPFANGRLVLWLPYQSNKRKNKQTDDNHELALADLKELQNPGIRRIALANPALAPYGGAAQAALRAAGVWNTVQQKLVYGQDVGQAAQFVATGNAQAGLLALSLVRSSDFTAKGSYALIPAGLHQPLVNGLVVTKRGTNHAAAERFKFWFLSGRAESRLAEFGLEPQQKENAKRLLDPAKR